MQGCPTRRGPEGLPGCEHRTTASEGDVAGAWRPRHVRLLRRLPLAAVWLLAQCALAQPVHAQGIMVSPVIVQMAPGQMAAVVTVTNHGDRPVSFQVRPFGWTQTSTEGEQLDATDELWASPPLATLKPGAAQVVRLVLRRLPDGREATYRILLDELPAPAEPQHVRVALRLSIPVFAEPKTRVAPHVQWQVTTQGGQTWLTAVNDGDQHQTFHDIVLHTADGRALGVEYQTPPHVLAGGTRRWRILTNGPPPAPATLLRLSAGVDNGVVDQQVRVDGGP